MTLVQLLFIIHTDLLKITSTQHHKTMEFICKYCTDTSTTVQTAEDTRGEYMETSPTIAQTLAEHTESKETEDVKLSGELAGCGRLEEDQGTGGVYASVCAYECCDSSTRKAHKVRMPHKRTPSAYIS